MSRYYLRGRWIEPNLKSKVRYEYDSGSETDSEEGNRKKKINQVTSTDTEGGKGDGAKKGLTASNSKQSTVVQADSNSDTKSKQNLSQSKIVGPKPESRPKVRKNLNL